MSKRNRKHLNSKNSQMVNKIIIRKKSAFSDEVANIKTVEAMFSLISKKIPNPDIILKKIGKGIEFLRTLSYDEQVATCMESRSAGVTSLEHKLTYSDSNQKYSDFYSRLLKKIDIDTLIKDILNAPAYGFQPIEIIWDYKDGFIIPVKICAKPQEWFFFNPEHRLCYKQKGMPDGFVITDDMKKFLCPVKDADYLNPYGRGYLSRCFWNVAFKKGSMEFWVKFSEKFGMPYVIAKYEEGTPDNEIDDLLMAADKMVQDAAAVIPNSGSIQFLEAGGKTASAEIYKGLIDVCDSSIAKNILGQTLTTDNGNTGSYALGQVHFQVRQDIINSDKKLVESQFNKLLKWVHELNFGDDDAPEFELYAEEEVSKTLAERDQILSSSGVKFTKNYFMKAYGFTEEDIEVPETVNNSEFAETKSNNKTFIANQAAKELVGKIIRGEIEAPENNSQLTLDNFIDSFSDNELEDIISDKIMPIIKNFAEKQDPQQALDELAVLYPEKDSKSLEETLAKAIFLSNIWGRVNAEDE